MGRAFLVGAWWAAVGCGGKDKAPEDSAAPAGETAVDPTEPGETGRETPPDSAEDTGDGSDTARSGLTLTASVGPPGLGIGLTGVLSVVSEVPVRVRARLEGDGLPAVELAFAQLAAEHELPLLGLRPDLTYQVVVWGEAEDGSRTDDVDLVLQTDPLPVDFPEVEVLVHVPGRVEPGLLLFPVQSNTIPGYLVVLDEDYQPVWYYQTPGGYTDARQAEDGSFWGLALGSATRVSAWEGLLTRWHDLYGDPTAIPVDTLALHHSVQPEADGSFWTLTYETLLVEDKPLTYNPADPLGRGKVADNSLARINPDGSFRERRSLSDLLDRRRLAWDSLSQKEDWGDDWAHANALEVRPSEILVSLRHQDAVVELDPATFEVRWILANPFGWPAELQDLLLTPVGPELRWPNHQHAARRGPGGLVVMFDNRNYENTPYEGPPREGTISRIVAYEVDAGARTVRQAWEFAQTSTGPLFSGTMGDADLLPVTGNVLGVYGSLKAEGAVSNPSAGRGDTSGRIVEFHPDDPDEVLLDLRVSSDRAVHARGWNLYRAQRLNSLYPPGMLE